MRTTTRPIASIPLLLALLALLLPLPALAVLHAGNVTTDGSHCIGTDCNTDPPSPTYGFDTLRLMENNLRILAWDTSGGSFPTRDWQIEFNSSSSGGPSYFMVRDCGNTASTGSNCGGTAQFTIEAGADNDSIYVDSSGNQGGNVGFGTTSPAVDLHVLSGNTPTLRLEQDNSSGFTPQSWDLAGNESNFFIRDVTNGSSLPFRIEPGVASNTLYLDNQERIGFGTTAPAQAVHLRRTDGSAQLFIEEASGATTIRTLMDLRNNGGVRFDMNNTSVGKIWRLGMNNAGTSFTLNAVGSAGLFTFLDGGNMTIVGSITTGGPTCGTGCDLVFAPDYPLESIAEHAAEMWSRGYLPAVGPTAEGAPFNITEKTGGMLNELEKAHIYIEQLNRELQEKTGGMLDELEKAHIYIEQLHRELEEKSGELTSITERLARLEALLPSPRTH